MSEKPLKGRGSASNPKNRFERLELFLDYRNPVGVVIKNHLITRVLALT